MPPWVCESFEIKWNTITFFLGINNEKEMKLLTGAESKALVNLSI